MPHHSGSVDIGLQFGGSGFGLMLTLSAPLRFGSPKAPASLS